MTLDDDIINALQTLEHWLDNYVEETDLDNESFEEMYKAVSDVYHKYSDKYDEIHKYDIYRW